MFSNQLARVTNLPPGESIDWASEHREPPTLPKDDASVDLRLFPADCDRDEVVEFIQHQFKNRFDAVVHDDTPSLYRVIDRTGQLVAAFGVCRNPESFFVRHYIGDVIETLRKTMGPAVTADNVLELNHLCAGRPAILCALAPIIARHLYYEQGVRFVVCTATSRLSQFLVRKNLASVRLGLAVQSDLPTSQQGSWGTYYDHEPIVLAGDLHHAVNSLCGNQT